MPKSEVILKYHDVLCYYVAFLISDLGSSAMVTKLLWVMFVFSTKLVCNHTHNLGKVENKSISSIW